MQRIEKPRMAIVSRVLPFPGYSGQQQRVAYTLRAFREHFHITFITVANSDQTLDISKKLAMFCDEVLLLPSVYDRSILHKIWYRLSGLVYTLRTGLKFSNYLNNQVELSSSRLDDLLAKTQFECAVFEYWHATNSLASFQKGGITCVLDMHDILWQSYLRDIQNTKLPLWLQTRQVRLYRQQEENAWRQFDGLIAINREEYNYIKAKLPKKKVFYAPMGIDLAQWPYCWQPVYPQRIAYYGGLSSAHNQRDALRCYHDIMPGVWEQYPEAELWLVGSNPPEIISDLAKHDSRVRVTGFVEKAQDVLRTMQLVLCPWQGRYGFRSRIVEVMSLGIPVVATPDAVYGMDLEHQEGLFLAETNEALKQWILLVLSDIDLAQSQSIKAHEQVVHKYSYDKTYIRLAEALMEFFLSKPSVP